MANATKPVVPASTRPLKGWWTLLASVGVAGLGAAQIWLQNAGASLIPVTYVGPLVMGIGFGMAWLRSITDTTVGSSQ